MKVLIVDFDLFSKIGGGQTIYRNIMLRNPAIQFWYFTRAARRETDLPSNAATVRFTPRFIAEFHPTSPRDEAFYSAYLFARNLAYSVRGMRFDVVDVPDYYNFTAFLAPALREFNVRFSVIAQSLHGRLSATRFINWDAHYRARQIVQTRNKTDLCAFQAQRRAERELEDGGLQAADLRYSLSQRYISQLCPRTDGLMFEYLDPLKVVEIPDLHRLDLRAGQLRVLFVGRLERTKGPDTFLELVWLSGAHTRGVVQLIGADELMQGMPISLSLLEQARRRGIQAIHVPSITRRQLLEMFVKPCLVLAPSRFETFGLAPLEAILRGSLSGFSSVCGIHEYVQAQWPELRYALLCHDQPGISARNIRELLDDFENARAHNWAYLRDQRLNERYAPERISNFMLEIYSQPSTFSASIRDQFEYEYFYHSTARRYISTLIPLALAKSVARRLMPPAVWEGAWYAAQSFRNLQAGFRHWASGLRMRLRETRPLARFPALDILLRQMRAQRRLRLHQQALDNYDLLCRLAELVRYGRAKFFHALALAEKARRNPALGYLYLLRVWRWTGQSVGLSTPAVAQAFRAAGFEHIAEAIPYLLEPDYATQIYDYLTNRVQRFTALPERNYTFEARYVSNPVPRVSIIVSLYNAQNKLHLFTNLLAQTDLVCARQAEVIFIDSASPIPQFSQAMLEHLAQQMEVTFLRTPTRENIPAAWNRGIAEARGEYLVFLGVDEMVTIDALSKLASYLDRHPEVDWVSGNAVVTNVDRQGHFVSDVLTYNRSGLNQFSLLLDSSYAGYPGGMYRRSLHQRFGLYDTAFRAASDTEFKYRIYPFARFGHINQTLGIYLDYPEERMTAHPRAEIEDQKALYLFKTPGGLRYLLQNKTEAEIYELLCQAVGFRRSYATTTDTDFDFALNIATHLAHLNPREPRYRIWLADLRFIQNYLRALEQWDGSLRQMLTLSAQVAQLMHLEEKHSRLRGARVYYHILNDVRYAVHANVWRASTANP